MGRLGKLNLLVRHYLDPIAPGITKVESFVEQLHPALPQCPSYSLTVIDDKPEVAFLIRPLGFAETQLDELIPEIDEGIVIALATQCKVEDRSVELERSIEVVHL
jgi:hypothetical protein